MNTIIAALLDLVGWIDIVTVADLFTNVFKSVFCVGFIVMFINMLCNIGGNGRRLL